MLRVRRIEGEEGGLDLCRQRRVEGAAHGPVVVVVGRRGGKDLDLVGVDLAGLDQFFPDAGVEHTGIDLARLDPGHGGVMGAGVTDAAEEGFRLDAVLQHEVARHQAAGCRGHRAEGEGLALEVGEGFDVRVGGDELAGELRILLALHQRHGITGFQARLDEGEAAQPGHVDPVGGQRLDHGRIVADRHELDLHAQLLFQISAQGLELAQQFGGGFIGNGADLEDVGGLCQQGGKTQGQADSQCQGAFEHESSPVH
ncbi:hypothetical protein D3C76_1029040 [compost metagenome]